MHPDDTSFAAHDDFALMREIAAGKQPALAVLFDRHAPLVLALCRRILKDQPLAEEVLNDVFWELWNRSDRYWAQRSSPRTYILVLARSRAIDRLRSENLHRKNTVPYNTANTDSPPTDPQPNTPTTQLESAVQGELRRHVIDALKSLDPQRRQAVELSFFEGLSHNEIAQQLNQPLGTIKTRIRLGLIHLRQALLTYHHAEDRP